MLKHVHLRAFLMLAVVSVLALGACTSSPSIETVEIDASEYAFNLPASIDGGPVSLKLTNSGEESHHAQLVKLNDGVTQEALLGAMAEAGNPGPVFAMSTLQGGPAPVGSGGTSEVIMDLPDGDYLLLCFIESPQGVPHFALGMVQGFAVAAAPEDAPSVPDADATISLADFAFQGVPATVDAGEVTWKVTNNGPEPHEMGVLKLDVPAAAFGDIIGGMVSGEEAPAGPPPFEEAGGMQGLLSGSDGYAVLDLEAGDYAVICFIPSAANAGAPHFALGMWQTFTVE